MKKQFAGTKAQHRKAAGYHANFARSVVKSFRERLKAGDCRMALHHLAAYAFHAGAMNTDRNWARQRRGDSTPYSVQNAMESKFAVRCHLPRKKR